MGLQINTTRGRRRNVGRDGVNSTWEASLGGAQNPRQTLLSTGG